MTKNICATIFMFILGVSSCLMSKPEKKSDPSLKKPPVTERSPWRDPKPAKPSDDKSKGGGCIIL